jgi:site-specific DNA-methyltransferase (adenine-specific)
MMEHIADDSIDLIYMDPPFLTRKQFDTIWGESKATIQSFEDAAFYKKVCGKCGTDWKQKSDGADYERCANYQCDAPLKDAKDIRMNDIETYVGWLKARLQQCYRVLKPTGSIYVHLDYHTMHYIKVVMDDIFGYNNFRNEITWKRTSSPKTSQFKDKKYSVVTDTLLYYSKTDKYTFEPNRVRDALSPKEIEAKYPLIDDNGRYHLRTLLRSKSMGERPNLAYEYNGFTPDKYGWRMVKDKVSALDAAGNLHWNSNGNPYRKIRDHEDKGKPISNLWDDIPNAKGNELIGYPTQKPEKLLERVIKASSDPGDLVLDCFCGCGTTITVAQRLNRKWIGIDIEPLSCTIQQARMERTFGEEFPIIDIGKQLTDEEANQATIDARDMEPYAFQNWVVDVLEGKQTYRKGADDGIDGWIDKPRNTLIKGDLIQVKRSDSVGKNVVKLHVYNTRKIGRKCGLIVGFGFTSGAIKEARDIRAQTGIDIELLTVKSLLMQTGNNIKSTGKQSTGAQSTL